MTIYPDQLVWHTMRQLRHSANQSGVVIPPHQLYALAIQSLRTAYA